MSWYDEKTFETFKKQHQFVQSFISKLKENNRTAFNSIIDTSTINLNNHDDLLEYIGTIEKVKMIDFNYFVINYYLQLDHSNPVIESTFLLEINQHFEANLVVSNLHSKPLFTRVDLTRE